MNEHSLIRCGSLVLLGAALVAPSSVLAGDPPARPKVDFAAGLVENRLARSPDGKQIIRLNGTTVARFADVRTGKPVGPALKHSKEYQVLCWAFSPDGKLAATGAGRRHEADLGLRDNEGEIRVWEVATGNLVAEFNEQIGSVRDLAFTSDSMFVRYKADPFKQSGK